MSFLHPIGLLGLLGVPILIIIYIIKNKHTEQIIPSTYIWNLSEKFLKKRKRKSPLSGLISLILQILIVITISLLIAHPVLKIKNAAKDYCFIVDGSGSMNMMSNGITRMELGKQKIQEIIEESGNGSMYTLIYAGSTTRVVYEKLTSKEKACELLLQLKPAGVTENYKDVLRYAQEYFNDNNSLTSYLITDKDYTSKNIEIINVSNNEQNFAVCKSQYEVKEEKLVINGSVISYEQDDIIKLEIIIDEELQTTLELDTKKMIETNFTYESTYIDFNEIKLNIINNDGLMLDNERIMYHIEKENTYKTLIISQQPFYIQSMLAVVSSTDCYIISPENYDSSMNGYDLYIFDGYSPEVLPTDGTVWFFAADKSVSGAGFSVQEELVDEGGLELSYARNSTSIFKLLTNGLRKETIYVDKYIKYGVHRNFTTLLTYNGNPVVFTGLSDYGNREVIFAFDLHNSNLPMLVDFLVLSKNLIDYSFPVMFEKTDYISGDIAEVNILPNCDSIRVESPSGNILYLDVTNEVANFKLNEAGTYNFKIMFDEEEKNIKLYSQLPLEESTNLQVPTEMSLQGELQDNYLDGIYDNLIIFFVILMIVYMADWGVYCYEQYQLR